MESRGQRLVVKRTAEVQIALRGTSEVRCGLDVALFSRPPGVGRRRWSVAGVELSVLDGQIYG